MRLAVGVMIATACHALLFLGLRLLAPSPRSAAAARERTEPVEVQVVAGSSASPVGQGDAPKPMISRAVPIRRSGRPHPSVLFDGAAGSTITPASTPPSSSPPAVAPGGPS